MVNEDLGSPHGALIFDESGFVKKGEDSVGVARQYCGTIGKVENCQVGVYAGYVSENGYSLIDKRLYIPEQWFSDDFRDRREKCDLPEDVCFRTKPQLAVDMLQSVVAENILPLKYVLADSVYGMSPEFIETVESLTGVTYFVSVPKTLQCWLKKPMTIKKRYRWGGKDKTKVVLADSARESITVSELAKNINDFFWYRRQVSEGTKGPIVYEFTRRQIILSDSGLPGKNVWLLIRRTLGEKTRIQLFHLQCTQQLALGKACLAQRFAMGHRAVFRGDQDRTRHGPLRGAQVQGLAPSHAHMHACTFLSLAPENQVGKKKHHLLRCRSLGPW